MNQDDQSNLQEENQNNQDKVFCKSVGRSRKSQMKYYSKLCSLDKVVGSEPHADLILRHEFSQNNISNHDVSEESKQLNEHIGQISNTSPISSDMQFNQIKRKRNLGQFCSPGQNRDSKSNPPGSIDGFSLIQQQISQNGLDIVKVTRKQSNHVGSDITLKAGQFEKLPLDRSNSIKLNQKIFYTNQLINYKKRKASKKQRLIDKNYQKFQQKITKFYKNEDFVPNFRFNPNFPDSPVSTQKRKFKRNQSSRSHVGFTFSKNKLKNDSESNYGLKRNSRQNSRKKIIAYTEINSGKEINSLYDFSDINDDDDRKSHGRLANQEQDSQGVLSNSNKEPRQETDPTNSHILFYTGSRRNNSSILNIEVGQDPTAQTNLRNQSYAINEASIDLISRQHRSRRSRQSDQQGICPSLEDVAFSHESSTPQREGEIQNVYQPHQSQMERNARQDYREPDDVKTVNLFMSLREKYLMELKFLQVNKGFIQGVQNSRLLILDEQFAQINRFNDAAVMIACGTAVVQIIIQIMLSFSAGFPKELLCQNLLSIGSLAAFVLVEKEIRKKQVHTNENLRDANQLTQKIDILEKQEKETFQILDSTKLMLSLLMSKSMFNPPSADNFGTDLLQSYLYILNKYSIVIQATIVLLQHQSLISSKLKYVGVQVFIILINFSHANNLMGSQKIMVQESQVFETNVMKAYFGVLFVSILVVTLNYINFNAKYEQIILQNRTLSQPPQMPIQEVNEPIRNEEPHVQAIQIQQTEQNQLAPLIQSKHVGSISIEPLEKDSQESSFLPVSRNIPSLKDLLSQSITQSVSSSVSINLARKFNPLQVHSIDSNNVMKSSEINNDSSLFTLKDEDDIFKQTTSRNITINTQTQFDQQQNAQENVYKQIMLNHVNEGAFICKIVRKGVLRRQSDALPNCDPHSTIQKGAIINLFKSQVGIQEITSFERSNTNKKTKKNRKKESNGSINKKIQIDPLYITDQFFKKLPFYNYVKNHKSILKQNNSSGVSKSVHDPSNSLKFLNNYLRSKESQNSFQSHSKLQFSFPESNQVPSNLNNQSMTISEYQSDSNLQSRFSGVENDMNQSLIQLSSDNEVLLNMKIYQPYFISNSTIIQYEQEMRYNKQSKPEKYSITDILKSYYLKRQNQSRLFFKVNLNDDFEDIKINSYALASHQDHQGQAFSKISGSKRSLYEDQHLKKYTRQSQNSRDLPLIPSSSMEEIEELMSRESHRSLNVIKEKICEESIDNSNHKFNQSRKSSNHFQKMKRDEKASSKQNGTSSKDLVVAKQKSSEMSEYDFAEEQDECVEDFEDLIPAKRRQTQMVPKYDQLINTERNIEESAGQQLQSNQPNFSESFSDSESSKLSQFYDDFESKLQDNSNVNNSLTQQQEDKNIRYFEFEIKKIDDQNSKQKNLTFLSIKDITLLVQNQQKFCDKIYQDAIENTYSHEQMTPLNPMISYSGPIKLKLLQLFAEKQKINTDSFKSNSKNQDQESQYIDSRLVSKVVGGSQEAKSFLMQITSIEQSSKAMYYYNINQIKRMKLKKNQLEVRESCLESISNKIHNILWPFENTIFNRRINVWIVKNLPDENLIFADWNMYEIILFNIFQNSVKYNTHFNGDIVVCTTCKPIKKSNNLMRSGYDNSSQEEKDEHEYILETQVIDSGIGISPQKQKQLFIPFLELKNRIGLIKEDCHNIGLGLSCSKDLSKKLGGDIKVLISEPGLTNVAFKIKVKIINEGKLTARSLFLTQEKVIQRLTQNQRPISMKITNYLRKRKLIHIEPEQSERINSHSILSSPISQPTQVKTEFGNRIGFQMLENILIDNDSYQAQGRSNHANYSSREISLQQKQQINSADLIFRKKTINKYEGSFASMLVEQNSKSISSQNNHTKNSRLHNIFKGSDLGSSATLKSDQIAKFNKHQEEEEEKKPNSQQNIVANDKIDENDELMYIRKSRQDEQCAGHRRIFKETGSFKKIVSSGSQIFSFEESMNKSYQSDVIKMQSQQSDNQQRSFKFDQNGNLLQDQSSHISQQDQPYRRRSQNINKNSRNSQQSSLSPCNQKSNHSCLSHESHNSSQIQQNLLSNQIPLDTEQEQIPMNQYREPIPEQIKISAIHKKQSNNLPLAPCNQSKLLLQSQRLSSENLNNLLSKDKLALANHILSCNHRDQIHSILSNIEERSPISGSAARHNISAPLQIPQYSNQNDPVRNILVNKSQVIKYKQLKKIEENIAAGKEDPHAISSCDESSRSSFIALSENESNYSEEEKQELVYAIRRSFDNVELDNNQRRQNHYMGNYFKIDDHEMNQRQGNFQFQDDSKNVENEEIKNDYQSVSNSSIECDPNDNGPFRQSKCDCQPRILVVDDNEFNMMVVCTSIQSSYNIEAERANDGIIAVEMFQKAMEKRCKCKNRGYKLILMDIQMPILNGFKASEQIRKMMQEHKYIDKNPIEAQYVSSLGKTWLIPDSHCNIVAVTSYTTNGIEENCHKSGMKQVIFKPIDINLLKKVISTYFFSNQ